MSQMYPSQLLFSQTTISSSLSRGDSIPGLINSILRGNRNVDSNWLPLQAARDRYDGKLYCQDNRRLYIFRVLQLRGKISQIPVNIISGSGRPKPPGVGPTIRFSDGTPTEQH